MQEAFVSAHPFIVEGDADEDEEGEGDAEEDGDKEDAADLAEPSFKLPPRIRAVLTALDDVQVAQLRSVAR
jgi:hypothetical protein